MTPEEMREVVEVVADVMRVQLEGIRTEVDNLRQEVSEAVQQVRDTAQVLHDNDTALMGYVQRQDGSVPAEFTARAGEAWARFVRQEAEQMGWRVLVPKGGVGDG